MARETKLIDVVKMLTDRGHQVAYYHRKDGSIRITKIDKQRFTGSAGNILAREIVGVKMSERRKKQLQTIRTPKGQWGHKRTTKLPVDLTKRIRRAQRMWRKHQTAGKGYPSTKNIRYVLREFGKEEAYRRLRESERYAKGLAYSENVLWISKYINDTILPKVNQEDMPLLIEFRDIILRNISKLREKDIAPIHDLLYDFNDKTKSAVRILNELKLMYQ